jgi:DNA-binding transcriptional regulator YhcF (GntR family)
MSNHRGQGQTGDPEGSGRRRPGPRARQLPLAVQALGQLINDMDAPANTKMPSTAALSQELLTRYGLTISRATVNKAMQVLQQQGRVVSGGTTQSSGYWTPGQSSHRTRLEEASADIARRLEEIERRPGGRRGVRLGTAEALAADMADKIPGGVSADTMAVALRRFVEQGRVVRRQSGPAGYETPTEPVEPTIEQVFTDRLRDDVSQLKPRRMIDTPTQIARRYGVTIETVTAALARLETEGLIIAEGERREARRRRSAWSPPGEHSTEGGETGGRGRERSPGAATNPAARGVSARGVPSFPGPAIAPPGGPARPGARAGERAAPEEAERPGAYPGPPLRPPAGGGSRSPAHDAGESADAPDARQRPSEIVRWGELLDDRIAAMVSCTFATAGDFLDWLQDRDGLSSLFVSVSGLTRGALMLDGQPIHPDVAEALRDGAASWAMGVTETVRTHIPQSFQDEQNRQTQPGDATAVPWPAESNTAPGLTAAAFDAITGLEHEPTNALEVWQWLQEDLPGLYDALAQMMNGLSQTLPRYPVGPAVLTAFANASGSLTEIADYIRGDVLPCFLERHHTELENITNPGPNQQLWDIGKNA